MLCLSSKSDEKMFFDKFKQVKAFVFDVDGVLSDGKILVTEQGDQLRAFSIRDGYALQLAVKRGYPIAAITGGRSMGVKKRLEGLGITDVFLSVNDQYTVFQAWLAKHGLAEADVLCMGDDIPDLEIMRAVGLPTCPADAVEEVKAISSYISVRKGGDGAVRDVIEKVMKLQQTWHKDTFIIRR